MIPKIYSIIFRPFAVLAALLLGLSVGSVFAQAPKWKEWEAAGDSLYERQDFEGAENWFTKVLDANKGKQRDREMASVLYKRAVCFYSTGQMEKALKDVDEFVTLVPGSPQPFVLKAFIYRDLDDEDKEFENVNKAIQMMPPNADFMKWRALLHLRKNHFADAKTDVRQAIQMQDDPESETYLGLCYYNLGKKDSAYMSFNKSIELDATYLPAYLYAGSVSLEDGSYELGLKYLNLALRLDPHNKEAMFYKGVALVELKKEDEGCRCLNKAFYWGFDEAGEYLKEYCYDSDN